MSDITVTARTEVGEYRLVAPASDHIASTIQRTGRPYENDLLRVLFALHRGGTFLDVGANLGNHAAFFAQRGVPVIAVEANPTTVRYLRENVAPFGPLVTILPVAAGSTPGRAHILPPDDDDLGRVQVEAVADGEVDVVALDSIAERVGTMKVDVEGGEDDVLAGAQALLERSRPVVAIEAWDADHRRKVAARLRPFGYRRFPVSLSTTPTYVYVPGTMFLARCALHVNWKSVVRRRVRSVTAGLRRARTRRRR